MSYSLNALYDQVGISKQAVAQYERRQAVFDQRMGNILKQADALRASHPGCGVEKMYYTFRPDFIGRDRFIEFMMALGYRVKRKKNYRVTTRSGSKYYPNLVEGLEVDRPGYVWQSDITYIEMGGRFYYAVFIIDVYSKEIVGYELSDHMRGSANVNALKKALKKHPAPAYHHSDRGSQYTYKVYTDILEKSGTQLSMGKIAQENAYAERINGTIKNEFLAYWKPKTFKQLKSCIRKAVMYYNNHRPHNNIGRVSPKVFNETLKHQKEPDVMTIFKYENC